MGPQNVNEPAQILPNLPQDIQVIRVRKQGRNDTSKEFNVRRYIIQQVLQWLKLNNPAYFDIIISQERLVLLPENAPVEIHTVETKLSDQNSDKDIGPAPQQADPGDVDGNSVSCVSLPEPAINIREQVEKVVEQIVGENNGPVTAGRKYVTIPWPTQIKIPLSEFTTKHFFTLALPCLFPYGKGDFHINRLRTCESMADWAEHLLWYKDGRFAKHQYFKLIVHNTIMRKRTLEQSTYVVRQQLGDDQLTLSSLKDKIENGDKSIAQNVLYFEACLRGTAQYWTKRAKDLRSLVQFQINEGEGLPSFFATGSCAEYHFKALRRLLEKYMFETSGKPVDLKDHNTLFGVLQQNTHIFSHYFDLRTQSFFTNVMGPAFSVDTPGIDKNLPSPEA